MERQTEQLEREARETRARLAGALTELRLRLTPGEVVDQVADYVREGPAADFLHNLAREMRENPIPLLLIATGIGWLAIASARRPCTVSVLDPGAQITAAEMHRPFATPGERWPEQRTEELAPQGA
jgi:hypothetical protein